MLCFDFLIAAKSRRSAAIFPFKSMPELRVAMSRRQQSGSTKQTTAAAPLLIWSAVNVPANPRPAATVVVLRDSSAGPEVFMVRRHEATAFMGGAHVFPGGRVDSRDEAD